MIHEPKPEHKDLLQRLLECEPEPVPDEPLKEGQIPLDLIGTVVAQDITEYNRRRAGELDSALFY